MSERAEGALLRWADPFGPSGEQLRAAQDILDAKGGNSLSLVEPDRHERPAQDGYGVFAPLAALRGKKKP